MNTARSTRLAAFAAVATSALALTGCGIADSTTPAGPAAEKIITAPRDLLLKAVPADDAKAYAFTIKGNVTPVSGVVDGSHEAAEINMAQEIKEAGTTLKMDIRLVAKKGWVKISFSPNVAGLPKMPKKWMLLDPAKLDDKSMLEEDDRTDPGYTQLLLENADAVVQTSPGNFTGTTDLTKATEAEIVEDDALKALGEAAKRAPFEAVVDDLGHLTSLVVKIPAAGKVKAHDYSVGYTNLGHTAPVVAPAAGEQQKATSTAYEMLNG
ncbi:hypothetical protein [Actinoplanes sp. NPDC026619]|uniref:hypothetical protein n=1 Tax=Actinoplanes sp. NPDC026619 TaxID=3155798 RepID=UPI003402856F